VIDLADPYDLSPAVNHIITTVQEARAADQKVILMLGETHSNIAHVRLAELVRRGLTEAGIHKPVMAVEEQHNLTECLLPRFYSHELFSPFRAAVAQALPALKINDPSRYHRLQALGNASVFWPQAPVTRLENFTTWINDNTTIRMVDIAMTLDGYLDCTDPETNAFITTNTQNPGPDPDTQQAPIDGVEPEGMRLRNLWMMQQLETIPDPVTILQTGFAHPAGLARKGYSYADSLHGGFAKAAKQGTDSQQPRVITVLPENRVITFNNFLSAAAQRAMSNPDTVILRGAGEARHFQDEGRGSFDEEIATLQRLGGAQITSEDAYRKTIARNNDALTKELISITQQYAPTLRLSV